MSNNLFPCWSLFNIHSFNDIQCWTVLKNQPLSYFFYPVIFRTCAFTSQVARGGEKNINNQKPSYHIILNDLSGDIFLCYDTSVLNRVLLKKQKHRTYLLYFSFTFIFIYLLLIILIIYIYIYIFPCGAVCSVGGYVVLDVEIILNLKIYSRLMKPVCFLFETTAIQEDIYTSVYKGAKDSNSL